MRKIKKIALLASGDSAWIGGIQYTINIVNALNSVSRNGFLETHILKNTRQELGDISVFDNLIIKVIDVNDLLPPFDLPNRIFWFIQRIVFGRINPRLENFLKKQKYDYVYPAIASNCRGRLNVGSWIADFQYHNFPDGHNAETRREAESTISFIANNMSKVVFSSKSVEEEALRLFPVIKGKSTILPFCVYIPSLIMDEKVLNSVTAKYGIVGPFIIVSNIFAAVKNHVTLFKALGLLRKQGIILNIVCTGNLVNYAQMEFTNQILQVITETGIRGQLYLLGLIPREDQIALYRKSFAIVQPSLHEGWSTCVEEAKALGKTIIISDIAVHREQNPRNAYYFSPLDISDLAEKLKNVYHDQGHCDFPDFINETSAMEQYNLAIHNFGELFLEIARK